MNEWFQQRFISRAEHDEVVAYYRKLVARLHQQVREKCAETDAHVLESVVDHRRRLEERELHRSYGENVIAVDFRRRTRADG
jgi:hypothetical protein